MLSICLIVRDEEEVLARCLGSVAPVCDEIIVVDTGSRDNTKQIAARFTDKIFDYPWHDDFAAVRNFAFSKASSDALMYLDADDVVLPKEAAKLHAYKTLPDGIDAVFAEYDIPENGCVSVCPRIVRRRLSNEYWVNPIHESLVVCGKAVFSDFRVLHQKAKPPAYNRNLSIVRDLLKAGYNWDFHLAVNCWLDAYLAGDITLADSLWDICRHRAESGDDVTVAELIGSVVLFRTGDRETADAVQNFTRMALAKRLRALKADILGNG